MCRIASLIVLAVLVIGPPSVQAATPSSCQRLRGSDRAPDRLVKLVTRPNRANGSDLVGCVLPRGPVHRIASSSHHGTANTDFTIRRVAGAVVVVDRSSTTADTDNETTGVSDLRTGGAYNIARQCHKIGGGECSGISTTATTVFATRAGRAVAAISGASGKITIASFGPRGDRQDHDSGSPTEIPPRSLRLLANVASWTHGGEPRSANIGLTA